MRSLVLPLAAVVLSACTSNAPRDAEPRIAASGSALEILRAHAEPRARLLPGARLVSAPGAYSIAGQVLRATVPAFADAPLKLVSPTRDDAWCELRALDVGPGEASVEGNVVVHARAAEGVDVVHVIEPSRVEELRVLRVVPAQGIARWSLRVGPGIAEVRVREGRVELVSSSGYVELSADPPWIEDARGTRRDARFAFDAASSVLSMSFDAGGLVPPIVVDPAWTVAPSMATARTRLNAIVLSTGKVLAVGGAGVSSAELYDPATNTWSNAGTLPGVLSTTNPARVFVVPLPGGKAFACGLTTAALWDGATTWQTVPLPATPRWQFTLVSLADGKVLLAGGESGTVLSTAEIFDPASKTWTSAGAMTVGRMRASGVLLASGKVLLVGGQASTSSGKTEASTEIFDPISRTWSPGPSLAHSRHDAATVRLGDGRVVVAGGLLVDEANTGWFLSSTEVYDPAKGTFSLAGDLLAPTTSQYAVLLTSGDALLAPRPMMRLSPSTLSWSYAGDNAGGRIYGALAALSGDRAIFVGGTEASSAPSKLVDLYARSPLGVACVGPEDCASGGCVDGVCCSTPSCAIGSSCATAAKKGTCAKLVGRDCAADAECGTGFCVDGFCCNRACEGQCEACDAPESRGTCTTIAGAPHGARTACESGAGDPCKATRCDGTDATKCKLPPAGTVACGAATCSAGVERHVSTCNASAICADVPKSCGAYACGATTCKSSCAASADCAPGHYCDTASSACKPAVGLGAACVDASWCGAGLSCVDGVCCGRASCAVDESCALPGHEGRCLKKLGALCGVDVECGSGTCVDGRCCDAACDGQCQACDVAGNEGKCVAVVGAPHGSREQCAADEASPCASRACEGTDPKACVGYVGAEVGCRSPSCTNGVAVVAASCDGKGACPALAEVSCGGFACDGPACRTSCGSDSDCVEGHVCQAGACKPRTSTCSEDGARAIALDGAETACAPFVCRAGSCLSACATSADCASGKTCAFHTRTCVDPASAVPAGEDEGGCSVSSRGRSRSSGPAGLFFLAAAATVLVRRRRAVAVAASLAAASSVGCQKPARDDAHGKDQAAASIVRAVQGLPFATGFARVALSPATNGFSGDSPALDVRVPSTADGALRIADPRAPEVSLEIHAADVGPTLGELVDGAVVHRAPDAAIVHGLTATGVEEVRVFATATAPARASWWIERGPGIARVRLREQRVEALDARGVVRLSSAPLIAVDARGAALSIELRLSPDGARDRLDAVVDTAGAVAPIYLDPAWSTIAAPSTKRRSAAVAPLPDGRVLVAGGWTQPSPGAQVTLSSAEIYDPATNTWSTTSSMATKRHAAAATLVSGKVLVTGGYVEETTTVLASSEWFDPATATWSAGPSLPKPRGGHGLVALPTGRLIAFLGWDVDGDRLDSDVLDGAGPWSAGGALQQARRGFASAVLAGKLYVVGGQDSTSGSGGTNVVDVYDAASGWKAAPPLGTARFAPGVFAGPGGKLWVVGGGATASLTTRMSSVEVFDPAAAKWSAGPSLLKARTQMGVTVLSSGRALVAGGAVDGTAATAELLDATGTGFTLVPLPGRFLRFADVGTIAGAGGGAALVGTWGYDINGPIAAVTFQPQPLGAPCTQAWECASGSCVDFACCSTSSCVAGLSCGTPTKAGTCAKVDGAACTTAAECGSGHCVDGVCCESACGAQCAACDVPGKVGRCVAAKGAPHGSRVACAGAGGACDATCDGVETTKCNPAPDGTPCGEATCSAGVETHRSTCDGKGACQDVPSSCGAYACGTTACRTACTSESDCAAGNACASGVCAPKSGKGEACTASTTCGPGLACVDGVCCGSAACPAGAICNSVAAKGECRAVDGVACKVDAECASGHCVDGRCCERACEGVCEACDVEGRVGRCTPVVGAPHGARPACPAGAGDACAAGSCDGVDGLACRAFPGGDVVCREASCKDGVRAVPAVCDGKGICPPVVTSSCDGYACDSNGKDCRARCTEPRDCAAGFVCSGEKCVRLSGVCDQGGTTLVASDGSSTSCAPFACREGACLATCASSADCAPGHACDPTAAACSAVTPTTDEGGCATTPGRSGTSAIGALIVAALAIAGTRRRRR